MAKVKISLPDDLVKELRDYIKQRYGEGRVFSAVIQQAVKRLLEQEGQSGYRGNSNEVARRRTK